MKGTRWFRSEHLGDCSSGCSLSEDTLRFCSSLNWTDDYQSSDSLLGTSSMGHDEGTWRVLSGEAAPDGSVQGDIALVFGPKLHRRQERRRTAG